MIINIIGEIKEETQDIFADQLNEAMRRNPTHLDIYLDSSGGASFVSDAMAEMVTEINKTIPVTIIAVGNVMSAAFTFFFNSKCDKKVLYNCIGMCHRGKLEIDLFDGDTFDRTDRQKRKYAKIREEETLKLLKRLKFTSKEIKQYLSGKDVFFMAKRMKQLLKADDNNLSNYTPDEI